MADFPQGTFQYTGGIDGVNVSILGGWDVTLTHGMTPGAFNVKIPMAANGQPPDKNGDVILRYGDTTITLKNCTIDKVEQDASGRLVWNVTILDRRYQWRFGQVSGYYNVRWKNGTDVREETKKKPTELAKICLQAMGETDYDIDALEDFDDLDWPEITWNVMNPAEALCALCERYEMRPIFDWQEDRVVVVVVGHGAELDLDIPYEQSSGAFDPPEKPGKIVLLCAPSSVQYDFPLEPVALDIDGKIKYPDQVAYKPNPLASPSNGSAPDLSSASDLDDRWLPWSGIDTGFYNISQPYLRHLALECMLRWYRVVPPKQMYGLFKIAGDREDAITLGDFGSIAEDSTRSWLSRIALQGEQNDRLTTLADPSSTEFDEYNQEVSQSQLQAWVYGQYTSSAFAVNVLPDDVSVDANGNATTVPLSGLKKLDPSVVFSPAQQGASTFPGVDEPTQLNAKVQGTGFYTGGFAIDAEHGLVKFSDQVYQTAPAKNPQIIWKFSNGGALPDDLSRVKFPATLWLRTRFFVRDKDTREFIRYQKTRVIDENNDKVHYEIRDDIVFKLTYRFQGPCNTTTYPPTFDSSGTEDNKSAVDEALDAYLDQIEERYEILKPQTVVYPGFLPLTLDGAIRQVTWTVDDDGFAHTRVSRDQEELHIIRDYRDRRLAERLKNLANAQAKKTPITPDSAGNSLLDVSGVV